MFKCYSTKAIAAAFTFSGVAKAGLSGCAQNLAFLLTNEFQIGQMTFQYSNCKKDAGGKGYSTGIANFCTGAGDAWDVVQAFHDITGGNDKFTKLDKTVAAATLLVFQIFYSIWKSLATNQKFWPAQSTVFDKLYFTPSQKQADDLGLKQSVRQAVPYNTAISRGAGDDSDSLGGIIQQVNESITEDVSGGGSGSTLTIKSHLIDEIEWLNKFLKTRAKYEDEGDSNISILAYKNIIEKKEYNWDREFEVLNDEDDVGNATCDKLFQPYLG
ncbi:hypothetical protein J3B02_000233 [Coemansia erecta]|nr:hypothetical protein J3B02_000233 [Coemansia erecta]